MGLGATGGGTFFLVFDSSEGARPGGEVDAFLPPLGLWPLALRPSRIGFPIENSYFFFV